MRHPKKRFGILLPRPFSNPEFSGRIFSELMRMFISSRLELDYEEFYYFPRTSLHRTPNHGPGTLPGQFRRKMRSYFRLRHLLLSGSAPPVSNLHSNAFTRSERIMNFRPICVEPGVPKDTGQAGESPLSQSASPLHRAQGQT